MCETGLHRKCATEKSGAGLFPPRGEPAVPEQPQPSGDGPLGHTRALQLGQKLWPVVVPPGMQLFLYGWGHIASACQVMEGMRPEGRTTAEVGAATNIRAPWEGHGEETRCTQ